MSYEKLVETTERICQTEEARREAFREELTAWETDRRSAFTETRAKLEREFELLRRLEDLLEAERDEISTLDDETDYLSVEQAVRHREASLEKLERHNVHLETFGARFGTALEAVEDNLDALKSDGAEAMSADPDSAFEEAREALDRHNESVSGLETNLTILNAYLI
jgi:DNA repair ATPase RecN